MITPEKELNQILDDLQSIQNRVAVFSDELDSEPLEDAEGAIDTVMDKIIKAIKENGWEVE